MIHMIITLIHSNADETYDYDIALLKVKAVNQHGILYNDHVKAACLPKSTTAYTEGLRCYISGWGTVKEGGGQ